MTDSPPAMSGTTRRFARPALWIAVAAVVAGIGIFIGYRVASSHNGGPSKHAKALASLNAGLAAQARGDLNSAQADYLKVLTYEPSNKYALFDLGVIDYTRSDFGLAGDRYRQVLAIDPNYEPALYNLAILTHLDGDNLGAIALYQRAVKANPNDANAHFNLALLLVQTGQHAAANEQMRIAIKLDPSLLQRSSAPRQPSSAPSSSPSR